MKNLLELTSEFSKVIRYKISKQKWTTFLNTDNMWKLKLKIKGDFNIRIEIGQQNNIFITMVNTL